MSNTNMQDQSNNQVNQSQDEIIKDFLKQNKYIYEKVLGKGDFSQVIKAYSQKLNCYVAVKVFKKLEGQHLIYIQEFDKEIKILQMIKDEKYVLQIIDKIQDDKSGIAAIVTELCDTNLSTILEMNKFDLKQVQALSYQLLRGLLLLQEKGVIHSNIKPDNILYNSTKNQFLITDFCDPSSEKIMRSLGGDSKYMSPEVADKQKPYSILADIYSIGLIIAEALFQKYFTEMEWRSLKTKNILDLFPSLSTSTNFDFINQVLSQMINPDQNSRQKPLDLLQHLCAFSIDESSLKTLQFSRDEKNQTPNEIKNDLKTFVINQNSLQKLVDQSDFDCDILELSFYQLNFDIENYKKISRTLKKCQNVTQLHFEITYSEVNDELVKYFVDGLSNFEDLTHLSLDLQGNLISSEGANLIQDSLKRYRNISKLTLNFYFSKYLGSEGIKSISNIILNQQNLSELNLNLASCEMTDEGFKYIGDSLKNQTKLQNLYLDFQSSKLNKECVVNMANSISKYKNITKLHLNFLGSSIEGEGVEILLKAIKNYYQLTHLNLQLQRNKINTEQGNAIGNCLQNLTNITDLTFLLHQKEDSKGGISIVKSLKYLKSITRLKFFMNNLNFEGIKYLADSIQDYSNIKELNLNVSYNKIGLEGVNIIAEAIKNYQNINILEIWFSGEEGIGLEGYNYIADSIEKYPNIKEVALRGLNINESEIQYLEDKVRKSQQGIKLGLSNGLLQNQLN